MHKKLYMNTRRLQEVKPLTRGSSWEYLYRLPSSSIHLPNLLSKQTVFSAATVLSIILFHSLTTQLMYQFLSIFFLNLNLCSLYPFLRVLTYVFISSSLSKPPLLSSLTYFRISVKSPRNLRLSKECKLNFFSYCTIIIWVLSSSK